MMLFQSLKCSWPLVVILASLLMMVSVVHVFLTPLFPSSLDYFGVRRGQSLERSTVNSSIRGGSHGEDESLDTDVDFYARFPSDLHGTVTYRGAPWKSEIGRWLSGCDSVAKKVDIVEIIGGRSCKHDCSGRGVCNRDTGQCRCYHGYAGDGCSENLQLECNLPSSPEAPYGRWMVSTCPAYCDKTKAMCFCGEGTKYPSRPVAEACGFRMNLPSEPEGPKLPDWSKDDLENVYTTNQSKPGWCNVDPREAYANKVKFKEECDCKYDGHWGRFCETPAECSCTSQCSGHGYCLGGACQCDNGWYGIDCSIPSILSSIKEWPLWLRPSTIKVPDKAMDDNFGIIEVNVKKKRPLIYVYEMPPDFNSHLLEGRHFRFECVNRIYSDTNKTIWTTQLYGSQMALYESILASPHRTLNGEEADYFFVPVFDSCIITRADDVPYLNLAEHKGLRTSLALEFYKKAYEYIAHHHPYWNISAGRDHIWFFAWDEGACYAPKEIWNSMMLVHWGNTNTKHNHSTTAYWGDIWDSIPSHKRGNHPCFDPDKDLVLPAWKKPEPGAIWLKLWARPRNKRTTLFYFNGNLGPEYKGGRPEDTYSMGIRQKLAAEFGSTPNKNGKLGRQHSLNVSVTPLRSSNYFEELASSIFCGVLPGDGWSGRMEDSIHQGCVPVIIQDGIFLPYENVLNYKSFAVRITEDEIPDLVHILRGINETEVDFMLSNIRQIWQRFIYLDSILLEAQRQRKLFPIDEDWAVEFSKLGEDDIFTTFIQILHYKLHNDPWRSQLNQTKEYGLPKSCFRRNS